jgi:hypothetical protein
VSVISEKLCKQLVLAGSPPYEIGINNAVITAFGNRAKRLKMLVCFELSVVTSS